MERLKERTEERMEAPVGTVVVVVTGVRATAGGGCARVVLPHASGGERRVRHG